jgi:hypothetical protein
VKPQQPAGFRPGANSSRTSVLEDKMKGGNVFFAKLLLIGRSFFSFLSHQGGIRRENNRHVPAGKSGLGTSPEPYEPQDQAACLPQEVLRGKGVQKQMTIKRRMQDEENSVLIDDPTFIRIRPVRLRRQ